MCGVVVVGGWMWRFEMGSWMGKLVLSGCGSIGTELAGRRWDVGIEVETAAKRGARFKLRHSVLQRFQRQPALCQ